jgi:RNA polymerase sigma-70 factor, ECF subfamily
VKIAVVPKIPPASPAATDRPARSGASVRALPAGEGLTDEILVERAKGGDRWAEEVIYRRYVQLIGGLCLRLLRDRSETEDVVQDPFALALEQLGSLRDGRKLR